MSSKGGWPLNLLLHACLKVKVAQPCLSLCDPMDYTVHGILQARILEWVAFPFSRGSSQPRDQTQVSWIAGRFFTSWATREALTPAWCCNILSSWFHPLKFFSAHFDYLYKRHYVICCAGFRNEDVCFYSRCAKTEQSPSLLLRCCNWSGKF